MVNTDKVQAGDSTASTSTNTTWRCPYAPSKAEQGWECPRCGRINAPWARQCNCSRNDKWEKWDITWNKDDCTKPWWYDYKVTCDGTSAQAQIDSDTFKIHPESTVYQVGGSDYWDQYTKTWTNVPDSTYYNQDPSTKTIHTGKTNYKE